MGKNAQIVQIRIIARDVPTSKEIAAKLASIFGGTMIGEPQVSREGDYRTYLTIPYSGAER